MDLQAWAGIGSYVIPCVLTLLSMSVLPFPNSFVRGAAALALGWSGCVACTMLVFNPVGIASAYEHGEHFPEARYDNNTVSVAILAGWLLPLATLAVRLVGRRSLPRN
jgi:hypothetical protein